MWYSLKQIRDRMKTVAERGDIYYEDDTKELLIIPIVKKVFGIKDDFCIFRDFPDAKCEKRRWDLQLVNARDVAADEAYAVFECKRVGEDLSWKEIELETLNNQLSLQGVNGNGNHYAQVYLYGHNNKFCRPDIVCLTNGLKWVRFNKGFFDITPKACKQPQIKSVEFTEEDIADYKKWEERFQLLRSLFDRL